MMSFVSLAARLCAPRCDLLCLKPSPIQGLTQTSVLAGHEGGDQGTGLIGRADQLASKASEQRLVSDLPGADTNDVANDSAREAKEAAEKRPRGVAKEIIRREG